MYSILSIASLRDRLIDEGILAAENCSPEENEQFQAMLETGEPLPEGVYATQETEYEFCRIPDSNLTPAEELNLIEVLKLKRVMTIQKWVSFFGVLTVINLILSLLLLLGRH